MTTTIHGLEGTGYDNIRIERFRKTIKYEDIYLKGYETMKKCRTGITEFIYSYNDRREYSSLDGHTPSDVYFIRGTLGMPYGRIKWQIDFFC